MFVPTYNGLHVACWDPSLFDVALLPSMTIRLALPPYSSICPFGSPYGIQFQLLFGSPLCTHFFLTRLATDLASCSGIFSNNLCGSLMGRLSITSSKSYHHILSSLLHIANDRLAASITSAVATPCSALGCVSLCCSTTWRFQDSMSAQYEVMAGRFFVARPLTRLLVSWLVRLGSVEVMRQHSL